MQNIFKAITPSPISTNVFRQQIILSLILFYVCNIQSYYCKQCKIAYVEAF